MHTANVIYTTCRPAGFPFAIPYETQQQNNSRKKPADHTAELFSYASNRKPRVVFHKARFLIWVNIS